MDEAFWSARWAGGRTAFHRSSPNDHLARWWDTLGVPAGGRVLVPLCGKTLDLWWLAERGFSPVGVEFVPAAVGELFAERGVVPEVDGTARRGGGVEVHVVDFLQEEGTYDAAWDRAALIALPVDDRLRYAAHLVRRIRPGGVVLLVTLEHDREGGPPFLVTEDEVRRLFPAHDVTLLARSEAVDPRFPGATEAVFRISV